MVQVSKVFVMFLLFISATLIIWFYMKMEWKKIQTVKRSVIKAKFYSWDM